MTFLIYIFQGWKIEFEHDAIYATNPINKDVYKIELQPHEEIPFIYSLITRGERK